MEATPRGTTPEITSVPIGQTVKGRAIALRAYNEVELSVDMDTCAAVDLIREDLVEKLSLKEATSVTAPELVDFQGRPTPASKVYWLTLFLIDSQGHPRKIRRAFVASPRPEGAGDVLLSNDSMGREGICIDTRARTWSYDRISLAEPEAIAQEIVENGQKAYVMYLTGALAPDEKDIDTLGEGSPDEGREKNIPKELEPFADVFNEENAKKVPKLKGAVHRIELKPGKEPPHRPMYPMSAEQLRTLAEYIREMEAAGRIRRSTSSAGAPVLFVPKKDGSLRLCVDYRGLNEITVKNRYPLPLIGELLDRLAGAKFISKIDLSEAYHRIAIDEADRWKTAFRTRYGHFEYTVMPFGLTNAPATFQAYIHRTLADLLDTCCVAYLDDILIYSDTREQHTKDLHAVLRRLRAAELFAKLKKCDFYQTEVDFLGFRITQDGIEMDPDRVRAVAEWPVPKSFRDIQVFLGFCNFYRKFIARYSHIAAPMNSALKGSQNGTKSGAFVWTGEMQTAFETLRRAFAEAPMLRHYNPALETRVETDASTQAASGVLSQKHGTVWHPVAFWSRKLSDTERRWATGQQELLAIVESLDHWAQYLQGLPEKFLVLTDHAALKGVLAAPARDIRGRLARWVYRLSAFDFEIQHRSGVTNPADGLSRRPDYVVEDSRVDDVLPTLGKKLGLISQLSATTRQRIAKLEGTTATARTYIRAVRRSMQEPCQRASSKVEGSSPSGQHHPTKGTDELLRQSTHVSVVTRSKSYADATPTAPREDGDTPEDSGGAGITVPEQYIPRAVMRELIQDETAYMLRPGANLEQTVRGLQAKDHFCRELAAKVRRDAGEHQGYRLDKNNVLWFRRRLVIPEEGSLRHEILKNHHDAPRSGHMGANKTAELILRKFHWPHLMEDVRRYVAECPRCQGARVPRHKPYGLLQTLELPAHPFQQISLDFLTGLPESRRDDGIVYDAILVVVCRMTKVARFLATTKRLDAAGLARILYQEIECRYGTPEAIVSDRDKLITSQFWRDWTKARDIEGRVSTAWHPQTDGQTERTHQTLTAYLSKFGEGSRDQWATQLVEAEFSYNNSRHATIGVSPFEALMGYHPRMIDYCLPGVEIRTQGVDERLKKLTEVRRRMAENWRHATEVQAKNANAKRKAQSYKVGDVVGLSTKNFRFAKGQRKLAPRFIPVPITEVVGPNAYRVQLPEKYNRAHNVFSVALLEPWHGRKLAEGQLPDLEEDPEEWEVEDIVSRRDAPAGPLYLVKWKGWPVEYNTWEPEEHLANASRILAGFKKQQRKSHRKWDDE